MALNAVDELTHRLSVALNECYREFKLSHSSAIPDGSTLVNFFFRNWYRPATFLFRKSAKVTNVQYAELMALIRVKSKYLYETNPDKDSCARVYERSNRMKGIFVSLWDAQPRQPGIKASPKERKKGKKGEREDENLSASTDDFVRKFSARYAELFADTILIDPYLSSAQVNVSPLIELQLADICAESGYIYACGYTVYMRRSNKVTVRVLREKLSQWIKHFAGDAPQVNFIIYSKEQFPVPINRDLLRAEENGLDELKFHLDKFFFYTSPVSDLFHELTSPEDIKAHKTAWPPDASYSLDEIDKLRYLSKRHNSELQLVKDEPKIPSAFLFVDRPIDGAEATKSTQRYFVCFIQEFRNAHQLFEIDESKPGWTQPVTLPHTLSAAMYNIARGELRKASRSISILDPFFGCGTTYFEAARRREKITFHAFDLYDPNRIAFETNCEFLSLTPEKKEKLAQDIASLIAPVTPEAAWSDQRAAIENVRKSGDYSLHSNIGIPLARLRTERKKSNDIDFVQKFQMAVAVAEDLFGSALDEVDRQGWSFGALRNISSFTFPPDAIEQLRLLSFEERLLFFVCWKSFISNLYQFYAAKGNRHEVITQVVLGELGKLHFRIGRLLLIEKPTLVESRESFDLARGMYSIKTRSRFLPHDDRIQYEIADIRDLAKKYKSKRKNDGKKDLEKYDIVISDPPYGFNVSIHDKDLTIPEIYTSFIDLSLRAVKNGGQVIFCVPVQPMNGQPLPFYMTADFIVKQFLLSARNANKKLRVPVSGPLVAGQTSGIASAADQFLTPYYWESERALRRAVVHFQVFE